MTPPSPGPARATDSGWFVSVNVAVTVLAASMVTVQTVLPLQPPPLNPVKVELASPVACSWTIVL